MKIPLVIHIGYPKTASTYLQKHFFPKLDINYLGKYYDKNNNSFSLLEKKILLKYHHDPYPSVDLYYELIKEFKKICKINKVNLFSDEDFLFNLLRPLNLKKCNFQSYSKLLKFLNLMKDEFDLKILIVIRKQPELLTSLYAQSFQTYFKFCNEINSFEKYINFLIKEEIYLNLDFLFIINQFKKYNLTIKIIPYEKLNLNHKAFFEEILSFIHNSKLVTLQENLNIEYKKENVRSLKNQIKFTDNTNFYQILHYLKKKYFPNIYLNENLNKFLKTFSKKITIPNKKIIKISKNENIEILKLYSNSNFNLSKEYNLNLDKYGYF